MKAWKCECGRVTDGTEVECPVCGSDTPVEDLEKVRACHECGSALTASDDRAEVYLNALTLKERAGGQDVLVGDIPDEAFGPFIVHADPCYTSNREKYDLA